jgi:hypothetical protein
MASRTIAAPGPAARPALRGSLLHPYSARPPHPIRPPPTAEQEKMLHDVKIKREQPAANAAIVDGDGFARASFAFLPSGQGLHLSAARGGVRLCAATITPRASLGSNGPAAEGSPDRSARLLRETPPNTCGLAIVQTTTTPMTEQRRCRAA